MRRHYRADAMHYDAQSNLAPMPGQRLRHRPTERMATFVKTVTVDRKQYLLCQADDRQGAVFFCFAIGDWEEVE